MKNLDSDWLIKGLIDYEYKKYVLLDYLNVVRKYFGKKELYPFLADLIFHYRNLISIKENQSLLKESFPKELTSADLKNLRLNYNKIIHDGEVMQEIEEILNFAIPSVKHAIEEGRDVYDFVESQCEISPIGVTPLYAKEGYMLVTQPPESETAIYRYMVTIFENKEERFRGINTTYLDTKKKSPFYTYEQLKLDLLKEYKELPNPATYLILSKFQLPKERTLLPVAKRMLIRLIQ